MKKIGLNKIVLGTILCFFSLLFQGLEVNATSLKTEKAAVLQVEGYNIEGDSLIPGREATVHVKVKNYGASDAVNAVMTYTDASGKVYSTYGEDNQIYIGTLEAGKTAEVTFQLVSALSITDNTAPLTCEFVYMSEGVTASNKVSIAMPVKIEDALEIVGIKVAENARLGGLSLINLSYVNYSGADINNAKLLVNGNVTEDSAEIDLGTVVYGKRYNSDFYISFVESGNQEISLQLVYTDVNGVDYQVDEGTYQVYVSNQESDSQSQIQNSNTGLIGLGVAGVLSVLVLVIVVVYIKKQY